MDQETSADTISLRPIADLRQAYGNRLAFSPDGNHWVSATTRAFHLWNGQKFEPKVMADRQIHDLVFRANGEELGLCPARYHISKRSFIDTPSVDLSLIEGLSDPPAPDQFGIVACTESQDGSSLVISARYAPSREFEATDGYRGPIERVLLFHGPQRAFLAALYQGDQEFRALAIGDQHIVAGGQVMQVWDRSTGKKLADLRRHPAVVRSLEIDRRRERLYAVGADGLISVWRTTDWSLIGDWQAHDSDVNGLALHGERSVLATAGSDGKLRLWSLDSLGRLRHEKVLPGSVEGVALSPAGDRLVAAVRAFPARLLIFELTF